MNDRTVSLMRCKDENLCNLYVGGCIGGIKRYIGNIISCEWFNSFIDTVCLFFVAMKTHIAEVSLYKSRLDIGHSNGRMSHINP